ncbi:hypothetical protein TpMuguga_02g00321 [Theileria parva strain Muguga]|uniref:Uncharacterized protein n=1 Tax=Theileria parva TaxID=5875 RepID=Q4N5G9_THEPA|nr:uncharacterized protein TpMuguga_02g00321 [Theileria parva strain Muguga]EAN32604.1 hypothetical protein TpMuguga_02g00321 [Theileria parva strain Muguga]|eukprot:XP_764887.1 hypothetical protein [Theileria parva strain Muguga]
MPALNTSGDIMESSSPKMSRISQTKNSPNRRSSPQPLKFRSFDAFYQDYSKKNTYEVSQHRTPLTQNASSNNKSSHYNIITTDSSKKLDSKCGVSSEASKPKVTYTIEDYNIKGRVKRLCEIFQKARNDNHYRSQLEKVISNNKLNSKKPVPSTSKHVSDPQNDPQNYQYQQQMCIKRDQNTMTETDSLQLKFAQGSDLPNLDHEEVIFNTPLRFQSPSRGPVDDYDYRPGYPSPKIDSPLMSSQFVDEKRAPTIEEISSMLSAQKLTPTYSQNEVSVSNTLDKNALIDDILNNFMNDPEFCDTFFSKLETLNLYNNPNTAEFSKLIDELQFLVENDSNIDNLTKLDSVDHKKDFEWFFNQPKVFDFSVQDQNNAVDHKPHLFENDSNITSSTSTEYNLLLEQSSSDSLESLLESSQLHTTEDAKTEVSNTVDANAIEESNVEDTQLVEDSKTEEDSKVEDPQTEEDSKVEDPQTEEDSKVEEINTELLNVVEDHNIEDLNNEDHNTDDTNTLEDSNAVEDPNTDDLSEDPNTEESNVVEDLNTEHSNVVETLKTEKSEPVPVVEIDLMEENQPDFSDFEKFNLESGFNSHLSKHFDWINTNN